MNNEAKTITDIEYNSLEGYQNKFYRRKKGSKKLVPLKYYYNPPRESWSNKIDIKLDVEKGEGGKICYEFNKRFSYIKKVNLVVKIPKIKLRKQFKNTIRICYTRNLLHHIHGKGEFHAGGGICQTITPLSLDDYRVSIVKNIKDYDEDIGNTPDLTEWNTKLPADVLDITPPWLFNFNKKLLFPLYDECLEDDKIQLVYEFNLDISKLIRIEGKTKDNQEFRPIEFKWGYFEDDSIKFIDTPKIWCAYSNISEEEQRFRIQNKKNNKIDYTDIIEIPHNDYKHLGDTLSIRLHSGQPVAGISWKAQNREAGLKNDLSNYTTNSHDLKKGFNPISTSEIKYGNITRVSEREHYHFDKIYPKVYFGHKPYDNGYNFYYYDDEPMRLNHGHTVVFDNMSKSYVILNCTLGDTSKVQSGTKKKRLVLNNLDEQELFPDEDNNKNQHSPKFKVIAILYVKKRLVFDKKTKKLFVIGDKMSYDNYIKNKLKVNNHP